MKTQVKNALMTTAAVLVSIYLLRRVAMTRSIVDKALQG